MSDEQHARDLLQRATRLPDEIAPPVQQLIRAGRRQRKLRSAQRTLALGVVAVIAVVTPLAIRTINTDSTSGRPDRSTTHRNVVASGPTAAQIAKFRWSALPPSPLGPRDQPLIVAAGRYMIELGGFRKGNGTNDGAALDLKSRRWHKIAGVHANVGFLNATTVWTGSELFVTNGQEDSCLAGKPVAPCLPHAGLYNPVTNRWTVTQLPRAMQGLFPTAAVWTGRVVVLAALDAHHGRLVVGAYNPATERWQLITPRLQARHAPASVRLVATNNRVILWSLWLVSDPHVIDNAGVDVLAFDDDGAKPVGTWRNVTGDWPQTRDVRPPIFTGGSILIPPGMQWCEICSTVYHVDNGFFVNAITLRRTATVSFGPIGETVPSYLWTGRTIIEVATGQGNPLPFKLTDLTDYDPGTRTWRSLAAAPRRDQTNSLPVWTGSELVVVTDQGATLALHR